MCSWCWGFSPGDPGTCWREHGDGLRAHRWRWARWVAADEPMRDADRAYRPRPLGACAGASGQPFDFAFFDRRGLRLRHRARLPRRGGGAVSAPGAGPALPRGRPARLLCREPRRDRRRRAVPHRGRAGPGGGGVRRALEAPATRRAVALEWAQTAELGVTGYPTLLALQAGRPHVLSIGWRPLRAGRGRYPGSGRRPVNPDPSRCER